MGYKESIRAVRKFVPKLVKGKDNDRNTYQIVRDKESRTRPKLIPKPETGGITKTTKQLWIGIDDLGTETETTGEEEGDWQEIEKIGKQQKVNNNRKTETEKEKEKKIAEERRRKTESKYDSESETDKEETEKEKEKEK